MNGDLRGNASRYVLANARDGIRAEQVRKLVPDILNSYTVNIAYHANNPDVGMSLEKDAGRYKLFIYNKLFSDKLEANLGYVYESVVAQMLIAKGNKEMKKDV